MICAIRRALPSDATAACEVVRRSIAELCHADHRGDPEALAAWLANKTPANFEQWILSDRHAAMVAEIDGAVVAFGLLNLQGTVELLYVSPDARFRGVSKALLTALEKEAEAAGIRELELESSRTALPFYSRLGYTPSESSCRGVGVRPCYPMARRIGTSTDSPIDGETP